MSKDRFYGTQLDGLYRSMHLRQPAIRVVIWNPNRTTVTDVVLGRATSPEYDVTNWVQSVSVRENVIFENNEDSVASNVSITLQYDPNSTPIPITEKTLIDGSPLRIYQGDQRIARSEWVPIFTGFIQGHPQVTEQGRDSDAPKEITIAGVERSAAYLNNVITGNSYEAGTDVGVAAVETAILFMGLERREIRIGDQGYLIGAEQSQLVDIEVLNGIAQLLFVVGKKPRFDAEGFLVAVDADLDKAPSRVMPQLERVVSIVRQQSQQSTNNSVRVLGLDNQLTEVQEQEKRLASGTITSAFWEDQVDDEIFFSEDRGQETGGRKAKDTRLSKAEFKTFGEAFGENAGWAPFVEDDGVTTFGGRISFDTGYTTEILLLITTAYLALAVTDYIIGTSLTESGLFTLAASAPSNTGAGTAAVGVGLSSAARTAADLMLMGMFLILMNTGRLSYEIHGVPIQKILQQLVATAQLANLRTDQVREVQFRNDWLYDINTIQATAKRLLKRELVKGFPYLLRLLDDPLIDLDDVLSIANRKYYVTSIRKSFSRRGRGNATMDVTAWRIA